MDMSTILYPLSGGQWRKLDKKFGVPN